MQKIVVVHFSGIVSVSVVFFHSMIDAKVTKELSSGNNISIITLVDCLIEKAESLGASDIHIDPKGTFIQVRLRVDGVLQDSYVLPKSVHKEIVSRIKVLSKLRTDEHNAAQDGRFRFGEFPNHIDMRVSIIPTYYGENVVMRLLSDKAKICDLKELGFSDPDIRKIEIALKKPSGMILSTGPTGSGKTTTLYTLLKQLNSKEISIVTIEDPIEYALEGVKQIQINARTELTFANGLRSVLRQDPNVIMVGEIRDRETAHIAVNTALTGHLLLSTLHTNDAATTLPRLLDMGIESFLIASTVSISIGQRLVRKICKGCLKEISSPQTLIDSLSKYGVPEVSIPSKSCKGQGCDSCAGSGYAGRSCISEVLVVDSDIREAIIRKDSSEMLKRLAVKNGMTTMFVDGIEKVRNGITTFEEVLRVAHE